MPDYRLYHLHPDSSHFTGVDEMEADDDGMAIQLTAERPRDAATELWCGGHKIARFDARSDQPAGPQA